MGAFMRNEVLIAVWACLKECTVFFEVDAYYGGFYRVLTEIYLLTTCTFLSIGVVGTRDNVWQVD